jgi:DNA-binding NtrC family response regulator
MDEKGKVDFINDVAALDRLLTSIIASDPKGGCMRKANGMVFNRLFKIAMDQHGGNREKTAATLGVTKVTLARKIEQHAPEATGWNARSYKKRGRGR